MEHIDIFVAYNNSTADSQVWYGELLKGVDLNL